MAKKISITQVKSGIGYDITQKRTLKALGFNSVKKLAESDPKEIAEKLGVSEKTSSRWIENANNLLK